MRRRVLWIAALLALAAFGAWVGSLTDTPTPQQIIRFDGELHPCFFTDAGELVTELVKPTTGRPEREFLVWDLATAQIKSRFPLPAEQAGMNLVDESLLGRRHRVFRMMVGHGRGKQEIQVFQVWPWRHLATFIRDCADGELREFTWGGRWPAQAATFNADETALALRTQTNAGPAVEVWDLPTGTLRSTASGDALPFGSDPIEDEAERSPLRIVPAPSRIVMPPPPLPKLRHADVVVMQRDLKAEPTWLDQALAWLPFKLPEGPPIQIVVADRRGGAELLRLRLPVHAAEAVLSPAGDLLALRLEDQKNLGARLPAPDPARAEVRAAAIQIWDLHSPRPWTRMALGALIFAAAPLLLLMALRAFRRVRSWPWPTSRSASAAPHSSSA